MQTHRHFKLEGSTPDGVRRYIGDRVDTRKLAERKTAVVTITRTGRFYDPRYGEFEITRDMLLSMVRNFERDVYGQKIFIDVAHSPSDGVAAEIKKLMVDGNKLRAEVEFTDYGIEAVTKRRMIYLSAEFVDNFVDNEQRKEHGPTLLGAGLTPRPVIKRLDPVQLSESTLDGAPTYLDTRISRLLNEEGLNTMKKLLEELRKKLAKFNLAENIISQLVRTFEAVAKNVGDEEMQRTLMSEFVTQGKTLADEIANAAEGGNEPTINIDMSGVEKLLAQQSQQQTGLTAEDVKKLLAEQEEENRKALAEQKEKLDANVKLFTETVKEAEGLKSLSDEQMEVVLSAKDMITADLTADQIKRLAENQIKVGNAIAVNNNLGAMGYGGAGVVHQNDTHEILSLQEEITKSLRGSIKFADGSLRLAEDKDLHPFVAKVLAEFDRLQAPRLVNERKLLAGGEIGTGDTNLPAGFQRTVIREALSDLRVLNLVQGLTDPGASATTQVPYETRDTSAVMNGGVVYEGNPIHRASVAQEMDIAYILPTKLAMLVSNEVMHFTRASEINWDAYGRNVEMNARIVRELIVQRICNEMQRAADAYGAVAVTGETFDTQLTGANSVIKTTNYPIVRPHQQRDLKGSAVGAAENPITITLNGVAISEYDGSGTQTAGTYYTVSNYNLGYITLVDQTGAPVTPADTGVNTIDYSYATNLIKFDLDNGSADIEKYLNGLLRAFGAQKALLAQDRFVMPNFALMSMNLNNTFTNASAFEAQSKRNGTDTNNDGDLDMVKSVPAFSTNAPGVDLGDERVILGQRGTLTYTVAKPFVTGEAFEAVDANGQAIGKKQAYGEEYSAIHVPAPIRKHMTSVLAYSFSAR